MKIALLAPFEESVPPKRYGGTELVVYNLAQNLARFGHNVTLFAAGGSKTKAKLVSIFDKPLREMNLEDGDELNTHKFIGIGRVLNEINKRKFDIIHNHIGWRMLPFADLIKVPMVTTLHSSQRILKQKEHYGMFPEARYISISLDQRKPLPKLNYVGNVYNGIDVSLYDFNPKPKDFVLFMARFSPEKGPVEAIKIAKRAKVKLVMAGKVDRVDRGYFDKYIKPELGSKYVKFLGEVSDKKKKELFRNARALLAPIQWDEPFGLTYIEALVSGTPVVTMRRGAAPEIINNGRTGFLIRNVREGVWAMKRIDELNRNGCRQFLMRSDFTDKKMAENYLKVYKKIV